MKLSLHDGIQGTAAVPGGLLVFPVGALPPSVAPLHTHIRAMSDVKIEVSRKGDDETFPAVGDTVVIHYTGTLVEGGTKFDSSVDRGSPFETEIGVGRVIQGWDEAIPKLSKGSKVSRSHAGARPRDVSGLGHAK